MALMDSNPWFKEMLDTGPCSVKNWIQPQDVPLPEIVSLPWIGNLSRG